MRDWFDSVPTAHSLAAPGAAAAAYNGLKLPVVGSVSADQLLPFQRRMMPWTTPPLMPPARTGWPPRLPPPEFFPAR